VAAKLNVDLVANRYFTWQSIATLVVAPLVTLIGPDAWQSAAPALYCGLSAEIV
jgi:hypothetical protein